MVPSASSHARLNQVASDAGGVGVTPALSHSARRRASTSADVSSVALSGDALATAGAADGIGGAAAGGAPRSHANVSAVAAASATGRIGAFVKAIQIKVSNRQHPRPEQHSPGA